MRGVAGWRDLLLRGRSRDPHPRAGLGIDLDVLFAFLASFSFVFLSTHPVCTHLFSSLVPLFIDYTFYTDFCQFCNIEFLI